MKKLNRFSIAFVVMLALACSAFAGDIGLPGPSPPALPAPSSVSKSGIIHTPGIKDSSKATSDSAMLVALNLLQNLLSVF